MAEEHGIDAVTGFLDDSGVSYEVLEHKQTFSAREDAKASGVVAEAIKRNNSQGVSVAPPAP